MPNNDDDDFKGVQAYVQGDDDNQKLLGDGIENKSSTESEK